MTSRLVVCMKWGTRYGPHDVNMLYSMVSRNATAPIRVVCYTDQGDGIASGVEVYPLPTIELPERIRRTRWRKLALWAPRLPGAHGTVLYLDLDVVITGSLDDFFSYEPGRTCLIRHWNGGVGSTAALRFDTGSAPHLFEQIERRPANVLLRHPSPESFITQEGSLKLAYWPASWCINFKHALVPTWPLNLVLRPRLPPQGTRLVDFAGSPQPQDALAGRWPTPWYLKPYLHVRPASWIGKHWR